MVAPLAGRLLRRRGAGDRDDRLAFTPWFPNSGLETVVFIACLAAGGFAMWRVWRDEHTFGY